MNRGIDRADLVRDDEGRHEWFRLVNRVVSRGMMEGVMEVVDHNAYDLKHLSAADISYNPSLGTGQLQVRDIHYVTTETRTTWEFCQLLDRKYLASSRRSFEQWHKLAMQYGWIKDEE